MSVCSVGRRSFLRLEEDMVLNLLDELSAALQQGSRFGTCHVPQTFSLTQVYIALGYQACEGAGKGSLSDSSLTPFWTAQNVARKSKDPTHWDEV